MSSTNSHMLHCLRKLLCRLIIVLKLGVLVSAARHNLPITLRLRCCRYFTVPFVLLALHMRPPAPWQLAAMGAAYAAVDAATIYMFLFRPFTWPDGSVARFMW